MHNPRATWFWIGLIVGGAAGVWLAFLLSAIAVEDWRCTSYSPVTGQCTQMQHPDYIQTPEE